MFLSGAERISLTTVAASATRCISLFDGAKELGVDLFLLDDGWFGNNHPRDNDHAGLGDWQVNQRKLPHGLSHPVPSRRTPTASS